MRAFSTVHLARQAIQEPVWQKLLANVPVFGLSRKEESSSRGARVARGLQTGIRAMNTERNQTVFFSWRFVVVAALLSACPGGIP